MPVTYLELENFKSYGGKQRIGPFQDFTSVIGPNGSGKSNLMDAISFVLGVQSRDLRSSQMIDLIFRPPGDIDIDPQNSNSPDPHQDPSPLKASATLVYQAEGDDSTETRFSRTISSKGIGEYRINRKPVSFAQYEQALASIGVLLKGRNFLVFQGDVESTARKTPKELVAWFEQISSSCDLKQEYDAAYQEMMQAEQNARNVAAKQKGFHQKRRELKGQKEEAEKFQRLVEDKARLLTEFFLWQLFHIRADIEEGDEALEDLNQELVQGNQALEAAGEALRMAKKEASGARSVTAKFERKRVKLVSEMDQAQPSIIQNAEEIKNLKKKRNAEQKKLANITREAETRGETLQKLEAEIEEYGETEQHLQQEYEETKAKGELAVSLTEEQEAEYERIREAAAVASVKPRHTLSAANRKLEHVRAKAASLSEEIKELEMRKSDAASKMKEFTERKVTLEEVRMIFILRTCV